MKELRDRIYKLYRAVLKLNGYTTIHSPKKEKIQYGLIVIKDMIEDILSQHFNED